MKADYFSWILSNPHIQTIVPAKCLVKSKVDYQRERIITPDQDFIDLDVVNGRDDTPVLVLFHGLEGSSQSHYALNIMAEAERNDWMGIVVHFRSCSQEMNLAPRFYHSGDSAEVNWILETIKRRYPHRTLFVCGVSLGGSALLRWLGEYQHQAEYVQAACTISTLLDLNAGGCVLSQGFNKVYTAHFLRTLKQKSLAKLRQYPGLFDKERMLLARTLYDFDNVVTAPLHGYKHAPDYWMRASAKWILGDITVPTLVLNAKNDPFFPGCYLPQIASPYVKLVYTEEGGHVGFAGPWLNDTKWLAQSVLDFFKKHN